MRKFTIFTLVFLALAITFSQNSWVSSTIQFNRDTGELRGVTNISTGGNITWSTIPTGNALQGPPGQTGPQGIQGIQGIQGVKGDKGDKGDTGDAGSQGTPGNTGATGASAYQVALSAGFVGTEAQWLSSLVGSTGAQGTPGAQGAAGQGVPTGGTAGQVLSKINSTNYNTQWVTPSGGGNMSTATYDVNANGVVDLVDAIAWSAVTGKPTSFPPSAHTHIFDDIPGLQAALDTKLNASAISAFALTVLDDANATAFKTTLGLENVSNTSDANKPVSTAMQVALDGKANTSHTQAASTIPDFNTAADARVTSGIATHVGLADPHTQYQQENEKGVANGYASLDSSTLVPLVQIPNSLDDVLAYANQATFPATGTTNRIYLDNTLNKIFRWTGSAYQELSIASAASWGTITGTLSNQTDLQNALNAKEASITAGTTAQYYRGDKTFSDFAEASQDANGWTDTATIDVTYNDAGNSISATVPNLSGTNTGDQTSIVGITGTKTQFDTAVTNGDILYVGDVTSYATETAQDETLGVVADSATLDWTYNDAGNAASASVIGSALTGITSTQVSEGTNLYYTNTRADNRIAAATLDNLANVNCPSPSLDQIPKWNGTEFTCQTDATGGGGSVTDGDKGDITVSNTGNTWNVDSGSIELSDIAQGGAITGQVPTWNGTAYVPDTRNGLDIANTPAGNLSSTNIQAALNELDSEKISVSSRGAANRLYGQEDALAAVNSSYFSYVVSGTGTSHTVQTATSTGNIGIARGNLGTTATGRTAIWSVNSGILRFGGGTYRYRARFALATLSDATNTYSIRLGFIDSVTGESVDGIFLRYTHSVNGGEWECVSRNNSADVPQDTNVVAAAGTYITAEISVNAAATSATCSINGTVVGTFATAQIPQGANRVKGYGLMALRSVGTATFSAYDFDYSEIEINFTTPR